MRQFPDVNRIFSVSLRKEKALQVKADTVIIVLTSKQLVGGNVYAKGSYHLCRRDVIISDC